LYYEAAVAAAIPIIQVLENYYDSEPILQLRGIINGSCNYILHLMETQSYSFEKSLAIAQEKGFAESDPSLDIEGFDATYKACLLAYKSFGQFIDPETCERVGINGVTLENIQQAEKNNNRIKLIANVRLDEAGKVIVSVGPETVPQSDDLYNITAENNGIVVKGKFSGTNLYKGKGAGGHATASAIVADLYQTLKASEKVNATGSAKVEVIMN